MDYTSAIAALSAIESSVHEKEIHSEIYQNEFKKAVSEENDLLNDICSLGEQLTSFQKKKTFSQDGFIRLSKSNSLLCSSKADLKIQISCLQNDLLKTKDVAGSCDKKLQALRQNKSCTEDNSLCAEIDHLLELQKETRKRKLEVSKELALHLERLEKKKTEFEPNIALLVGIAKDYIQIRELEEKIHQETSKRQTQRKCARNSEKRRATEAKRWASFKPGPVGDGSIVDDDSRFGLSRIMSLPRISTLDFSFLGDKGRKRSGESRPEVTVDNVKRRLWPEKAPSLLPNYWDLPTKSKFTFELPKLSARPLNQPSLMSSLMTQDLGKSLSSSLISLDLGKSSLMTPESAKSSSMLTPESAKSSSMLTQESTKSSSMLTQELEKSSSMLTQELEKSSSMLTPDSGRSSLLITQGLGKSSPLMTQGSRKPSCSKSEFGCSQEFSVMEDSLVNSLDCSMIDNAKVPFTLEESSALNTSVESSFNRSNDNRQFNFGLDLGQEENNAPGRFNFSFSASSCQDDVFPF